MKLTRAVMIILGIALFVTTLSLGQENPLETNLSNLYRLTDSQSRQISPENLTGEKGKGGMAVEGSASKASRYLGQGWKVNPFVRIKPGETFTMASIDGPGAIKHIWVTPTGNWRFSILRMYWDNEKDPSVEVPVGDFFAMGWQKYAQISSLAVCVNPGSGLNSYWPMPFRHHAKITLENLSDKTMVLYYQIDYSLAKVPADAAYFHAQFRRVNPVPYKHVYTIVDGIKGKGQYVGTYLAWGVHNNGWWGEGEVKFYIDGDTKFPTIDGTGTEDYFGGAYDFDNPETKEYQPFTTPYSGLIQVIKPDGHYVSQERFGLYRWHIPDPVRFNKDLRVTIQDLGWRHNRTYLPLQDDIASVAYWYQMEPHAPFPKLPDKDHLENN